jgi:hypothetical protein
MFHNDLICIGRSKLVLVHLKAHVTGHLADELNGLRKHPFVESRLR